MDTLRTPLGVASIWIVLHSLDYFLTIWGATERLRRADQVFVISGSYELNPLFQKVVDRRQWVSARFLITLFGLAAMLAVVSAWVAAMPNTRSYLDGLLGVLLFTRTFVIARHLQNIWLFRRMVMHPSSVEGQVRYERKTLMLISAFQAASVSAVVVLAALLSPEPVLIGAAVGMVFMALWNVNLALGRHPAPAPASTTQNQ